MKKTVLIIFLSLLLPAVVSAADMLVNVSQENPGENCVNGGIKIEIGEDDDDSHSLEPSEVEGEPKYVCNGGAVPVISVSETTLCGAAGGIEISVSTDTVPKYVCNGAAGKNAVSRASAATAEESGCDHGGIKIEVGTDNNGDNILNDNEPVSDTKYLCNGADGVDGINALVKVSEEPKGSENCPKAAGIKIEVGIDSDKNNELDATEITGTQYVCGGRNGTAQKGDNGKNALSRTSEEPAGSNCKNGGIRVEVGTDINEDNVLNDDEVAAEQTQYVCNGEKGEQGQPGAQGPQGSQGETGPAGANGSNGAIALVSVVNEPKGENCASGGKKIETGLDVNGNGTLEEGEVDPAGVHYVCNGKDAEEAGLTSSSSGCAMTAVDGSFDWIYAFAVLISMFAALAAVRFFRR